MNRHHPAVWAHYVTLLLAGCALLACTTEVVVGDGAGANGAGGNNTGANNTGANNTGGNNTGASNTGGSAPVDCVSAENFDSCASPGSYCSYFDASTNEYCDAYCEDTFRWQKTCYTEPSYCYNPSFCPSSLPTNGSPCSPTDECDYYECEYSGVCGGGGYGYASCQDGYWNTYADCYCYQPPGLCPSSPPTNGTPCATTTQCQSYDCEWFDSCGNNTYDYAYCEAGYWQGGGDCG